MEGIKNTLSQFSHLDFQLLQFCDHSFTEEEINKNLS